jgi:hypothetical protein
MVNPVDLVIFSHNIDDVEAAWIPNDPEHQLF